MLRGWGVLPYLRLGSWELPTYSLMLLLAFLAGTLVFLAQPGPRRPGSGIVLLAALLGGILGSKLPYLPRNFELWRQGVRNPEVVFAGRTILGGLLGGTFAVMATRRALGIRDRRGDTLVPAIALGMALGRVGCLLRGCCAGRPTTLPWGVDFGDGVRRHPTQIYEALFALAWFAYAWRRPKGNRGTLFDAFLASYFVYRFFAEFIRTEAAMALGLTAFQLVCVPGALWKGWMLLRARRETRT